MVFLTRPVGRQEETNQLKERKMNESIKKGLYDQRETNEQGTAFVNDVAIYEVGVVTDFETSKEFTMTSMQTIQGLKKLYEKRGHVVSDVMEQGHIACLYLNWQDNDEGVSGIHIYRRGFLAHTKDVHDAIEATKRTHPEETTRLSLIEKHGTGETAAPYYSNSDYIIGDIVEYQCVDGTERTIKISAKMDNVKQGRRGFHGLPESGDMPKFVDGIGGATNYWGFNSQIITINGYKVS
jgi:hypothetical protein